MDSFKITSQRELLTLPEAAQLLGLHPQLLEEFCIACRCGFFRRRRRWLISRRLIESIGRHLVQRIDAPAESLAGVLRESADFSDWPRQAALMDDLERVREVERPWTPAVAQEFEEILKELMKGQAESDDSTT